MITHSENVKLEQRILSKQDVADLLGLTVRTIERLVASHKIPYISLPNGLGKKSRVRFDSRQIDQWLAENSNPVTVNDAEGN